MSINSIAIYCGSGSGLTHEYAKAAYELGKRLAEKNITLYYGGAGLGLMKASSEGVLHNNGKAIGIAPDFFSNKTVITQTSHEIIYVKTMSERKQMFEKLADAFVILPGGYGTMDEFFEVLTDSQLGFHSKPIIIYNINGYYDALIQQLERFGDETFVRPFHRSLFRVANTLDELFDCLESYVSPNDPEWLTLIKN